jgi:hypothetical protein
MKWSTEHFGYMNLDSGFLLEVLLAAHRYSMFRSDSCTDGGCVAWAYEHDGDHELYLPFLKSKSRGKGRVADLWSWCWRRLLFDEDARHLSVYN